VARGAENVPPVLLGLVALYDPARPDAKQLIATLYELGVQVKMLTGDALPVAVEIGQGVGLPKIQRVADLKPRANIGGFIVVSVVLGISMVAETLFLLWIGWTKFDLATNNDPLYTFSFLMLLYFAVFSVV
jgi:hypothetical protein